MKKNELKSPACSLRTVAEWDELIERYYEGMTTSEEERQLRTFLFSRQAADMKYDEHRAVMSYIALKGKYEDENKEKHPVQKEYPIRKNTGKRWIAAAAVAAVLVASTSAGFYFTQPKKNIYVAYVYGKKYTSAEVVTEQTRRSLHTVFSENVSVEQELSNVFGGLETNEYTP